MGRRAAPETDLNREAFEYWYSLGSARTIKAVWEKFGVGRITIAAWRDKFKWEQRARLRDKQVNEKSFELSLVDHAQTIANIRDRMGVVLDEFWLGVSENKVELEIKGPKDVQILTDCYLKLAGVANAGNGVPRGEDGAEVSFTLKGVDSPEMLRQLIETMRGGGMKSVPRSFGPLETTARSTDDAEVEDDEG